MAEHKHGEMNIEVQEDCVVISKPRYTEILSDIDYLKRQVIELRHDLEKKQLRINELETSK